MNILRITFFLLLTVFMVCCNLEKQIEITLPEYEKEVFVECYLIPGQPFRLLLSQTAPYFSDLNFDNPLFSESFLLQGADIEIQQENTVHKLYNNITADPSTQKVFNYSNPNLVKYNTLDSFHLNIVLPNGTALKSSSVFLDTIRFDSIVTQFDNNDSLARTLTYFFDFPIEDNFYRRVLKLKNEEEAIQDFVTDDLFTDSIFVFGSGYIFSEGDTVINTIYHIDERYYNFLESIQQAVDGSTNPFGVPSPIQSNIIGGGQGIFTCISETKTETIIKK